MSLTVSRPGGVTFIAVLAWIQGVLDIILGVILLFNQNDAALVLDFGGSGPLITSAIVYILVGIIIIVIARGLLRGSNGARVVVTAFEVITLAAALFVMIAAPSQFLGALVTAFIALVIILLLWTGRAGAFFRR
ncbi:MULTISPECIES: DUF7144 family membrane protein [unclassified Leifsonia]|uniref:DUF7144 family membrane protein n=1 Tax=unclassified Leifsonia TaxID=2663824 RepID=UPI0006FAE1DF|nr:MULTISPECIES: hypothetical protein [unclassified Leifsonia]KQX08063.1 hypothetical protein ASC59_10295 [Leifsonia sp. Root1293]KRA12344.1 hypothetical protein ASD61_10295 [Leifsonia sp. Root60]